MTRRQAITSDLKTKFGEITTANGYLTNIGNSVTHWKTRLRDRGTVFDFRDTSNRHNYNQSGYYAVLTLEIHLAYDSYNGSEQSTYNQLQNMAHDVVKCLVDNRAYFLNKYEYWEIQPQQDEVELELGDSHRGELSLTIDLVHMANEKFINDETVY